MSYKDYQDLIRKIDNEFWQNISYILGVFFISFAFLLWIGVVFIETKHGGL